MSFNDFAARIQTFNTAEQAVLYFILIALGLMIIEPIFAYFVVSMKKRDLERRRGTRKRQTTAHKKSIK